MDYLILNESVRFLLSNTWLAKIKETWQRVCFQTIPWQERARMCDLQKVRVGSPVTTEGLNPVGQY